MADKQLVDLLHQGVRPWNEWRARNPQAHIDLAGAELSRVLITVIDRPAGEPPRINLTDADLRGARLEDTSLDGADLQRATLRGAHGSHLNLNRANIIECDLSECDLRAATMYDATIVDSCFESSRVSGVDLRSTHIVDSSFKNADLAWSDLSHALLERVRLDGTRLRDTIFGRTTFRKCFGFETIHHRGPSIVDHRTLLLSDPLPKAFLQGCGLPDRRSVL